jgi:peroxiredoxin Q/BCP
MATPPLEAGTRAPAFALVDDTGAPFSSKDLTGKAYVLWFYPKADTPG